MLWFVVSLLTLMEDGFSEETLQGTDADLQPVLQLSSRSQPRDQKQPSSLHTHWPKTFEEWSRIQEDEYLPGQWRRFPRDPRTSKTSRKSRKNAKASQDCHLEKKEMRVRDLGFGHDSDEIILFKYCVGTCHSHRKNYDLALQTLMEGGSISSQRVSSRPCCRPTRFETVSFMDTQTTWQTIKWLSAANCSCVG